MLFVRCFPDLAKATAPVLLPVAIIAAAIPPLAICLEKSLRWWWLVGCALGVLASAWSTGVALHVAWRHVEGRPVDRREARAVGRELIWRMLGVRARYWFRCSIGYFLWSVPGLYWAGQYTLAEPAVYFERAASGAAMKRSAELTRGSIGRALSATLLAMLVSVACMFPLTALGSFCARALSQRLSVLVMLPCEIAVSLALMFVSVQRLVMYLGVADDVADPGVGAP